MLLDVDRSLALILGRARDSPAKEPSGSLTLRLIMMTSGGCSLAAWVLAIDGDSLLAPNRPSRMPLQSQ